MYSKRSVAFNAKLMALKSLVFGFSTVIKQDEQFVYKAAPDRRSVLPAAKQKEEEDVGTFETEVFDGRLMSWCCGELVKLSPSTLPSFHIEPQAEDATEIYGQKQAKKKTKQGIPKKT